MLRWIVRCCGGLTDKGDCSPGVAGRTLRRLRGGLLGWVAAGVWLSAGVSLAAGAGGAPTGAVPLGASVVSGVSAASGVAAVLPAPDTMASRVLACTACHGREGRATPDGYFPRLAGKPEGYLYHQLLNFREGRRRYPQMAVLLENLSDDYLREMAQHFAGLDLPYPPPSAVVRDPALLAQGRRLVEQGDPQRRLPACTQCHGAAMTGVSPDIPGLLGLPRDYLNAQLGAWQTGQRRARSPDCMADVARQLSPTEVSAVTAWLAAQPLPAVTRAARALPQPLPLPCGDVSVGVRP